jgi:hypothetical protein
MAWRLEIAPGPNKPLKGCVAPWGGLYCDDFDQPLAGVSQTAFSSSAEIRSIMMPPRKTNPRTEYRRLAMQRVNDSVGLAEKFPMLRSLRVDLVYFDPDGLTKTGELRYTVNVAHAKSVFSFACPSADCLVGDFDLSEAVTEAVAQRRKSVEREIRCPGTREGPNESKRPCQNLLRFKLTLGYV